MTFFSSPYMRSERDKFLLSTPSLNFNGRGSFDDCTHPLDNRQYNKNSNLRIFSRCCQDERVGLIGLGAVGTGLALCLADQGFKLLVSQSSAATFTSCYFGRKPVKAKIVLPYLQVADARPMSEFAGLLKQGNGNLQWASVDEVIVAGRGPKWALWMNECFLFFYYFFKS